MHSHHTTSGETPYWHPLYTWTNATLVMINAPAPILPMLSLNYWHLAQDLMQLWQLDTANTNLRMKNAQEIKGVRLLYLYSTQPFCLTFSNLSSFIHYFIFTDHVSWLHLFDSTLSFEPTDLWPFACHDQSSENEGQGHSSRIIMRSVGPRMKADLVVSSILLVLHVSCIPYFS